jgi:hypothetical protein
VPVEARTGGLGLRPAGLQDDDTCQELLVEKTLKLGGINVLPLVQTREKHGH